MADQEKKKLAVKIGGGGGIGAVVLLGGALATAALASVFMVRKKGWSSGKDGSRRRQSQDSPPEIKKDEENKGEQIYFLDQLSHIHKHLSGEKTREAEEDNDTGLLVSTETLKLDEKPRVEKLSSESQIMMQEGEVKIELIKEYISSEISEESKNIDEVDNEEEKVERGGSDDGEIEGTNGKEAIEITEMHQPRQEDITEVCYDQEEIEVTVEDDAVDGVHNDKKDIPKNVDMEEKDMKGFCSDNGEINEEKCEEVNENLETSETIVSERNGDNGGEALLPVFESRVTEEKDVNGDVKEGKCIEKLVEDQEKCDQTDEEIVPEKVDEGGGKESDGGNQSNTQSSLQNGTGETKIDSGDKEDDASIGNPTPENGGFGVPLLEEEVIPHEVMIEYGVDAEEIAERLEVREDEITVVAESLEVNEEEIAIVAESLEVKEEKTLEDEENDSRTDIVKEVGEKLVSPGNCQPHEDEIERKNVKEAEEEVISPENIEVTKEDSANEEVAESVEVQKNTSGQEQENGVPANNVKELEDSSETTDEGIAKAEDEGEANLSDEVEESSVETGDSSTESNSEAIWPAESLQETPVEPKKKLTDQEVEGKIQEDKPVEEREHKSRKISAEFSYENSNSGRSFVKKYTVNSTKRRMIIGVLSVVSSLSCSWFFGLSFVKLCLIVFLTMVLSKIQGY